MLRLATPINLRVRVAAGLVLDAGVVQETASDLLIRPPAVTLFRQVLDFLRGRGDSQPRRAQLTVEDEGVAAAAVVLRWGSYFAVLADRDKPAAPKARPGTSRISNSEMARINLEASAGLAEWIDIARGDRVTYETLVAKALQYLPLPRIRPTAANSAFATLALPDVAGKIMAAVDHDHLARVRDDAEKYSTRLFANALVNVAWRNGPLEEIHAGDGRRYRLDQRRLTAPEERELIGFAADRLTTGMDVCHQLALERSGRPWSEQVIPYGLAAPLLITPTGWSLTEATRDVRLARG